MIMITGITSTMHHPSIGAEPVIKPRMNKRGSYARAKVVREFLMDPIRWITTMDRDSRLNLHSLHLRKCWVNSVLDAGILMKY